MIHDLLESHKFLKFGSKKQEEKFGQKLRIFFSKSEIFTVKYGGSARKGTCSAKGNKFSNRSEPPFFCNHCETEQK